MIDSQLRIGLDVRMIENSGIGTTIREFLNHVDSSIYKNLILFSKPGWKNPFPTEKIVVSYPVYSLSQHIFYSRIIERARLTFFHIPHFDAPYFISTPFMATVHDLIHLKFPQYSTKPFARVYANQMIKRVSRKAKKIIVVSKNTRDDLLNECPDAKGKVYVIYPAVSSEFKPLLNGELETILNQYRLKQGYLLYVGNIRGSKNSKGMIEAYLEFKKSTNNAPPLVLVGKNSLSEFKNGFPNGIIYLGQVPYQHLPALYSGASLFLFPSFYEGFGLPPIEAMACGVPVLASKNGSIPEACGEAAHFVDAESVKSIRDGIEILMDSPSKRARLIDRGFQNIKRFSWKTWTNSTLEIYQQLGEEIIKNETMD